MPKKKHWTQTLRGKAKMRANAKRKAQLAKETKRVAASTQAPSLKEHVSYLYGKVETIIEYYSNSNGIPFSTLTKGVAGLLQHKESR